MLGNITGMTSLYLILKVFLQHITITDNLEAIIEYYMAGGALRHCTNDMLRRF